MSSASLPTTTRCACCCKASRVVHCSQLAFAAVADTSCASSPPAVTGLHLAGFSSLDAPDSCAASAAHRYHRSRFCTAPARLHVLPCPAAGRLQGWQIGPVPPKFYKCQWYPGQTFSKGTTGPCPHPITAVCERIQVLESLSSKHSARP